MAKNKKSKATELYETLNRDAAVVGLAGGTLPPLNMVLAAKYAPKGVKTKASMYSKGYSVVGGVPGSVLTGYAVYKLLPKRKAPRRQVLGKGFTAAVKNIYKKTKTFKKIMLKNKKSFLLPTIVTSVGSGLGSGYGYRKAIKEFHANNTKSPKNP